MRFSHRLGNEINGGGNVLRDLGNLFDLTSTFAGVHLAGFAYPWQALAGLRAYLHQLGRTLGEEYEMPAPGIWIHKDASVSPSAHLEPPCIIGPGTKVRHGAYIRGSVLVGADCVVGNSTEVKNAILFNGVQAPHYNYVGDSILGRGAHLGAGAVLSNVRADRAPVTVQCGALRMNTGLRKFGALVGDRAEIGCNAVLNPGTVLGRNSVVQPLSCVRGLVPEESIWKTGGRTVKKEAR